MYIIILYIETIGKYGNIWKCLEIYTKKLETTKLQQNIEKYWKYGNIPKNTNIYKQTLNNIEKYGNIWKYI